MNSFNKEILRLAVPSILANITVPLVGMVDTFVAGHLAPTADNTGAAAFIGAISVGAMLFSLLYWGFGFLRTGTGGLTAQAFGRKEMRSSAMIFIRSVSMALIIAVLILLLQTPFLKLIFLAVDCSPNVADLAFRYFYIRVWAAPATLCLMSFRGWFVGMQDTMSSMFTDLTVNVVNIVASLCLAMGIGSWEGLGFDGIPLGTVIAQYSGLALAALIVRFRYGKRVFANLDRKDLKEALDRSELRRFLSMNADLMGRSICFIAIYVGYTMIAATFGDMMLACSSIMMQLLMIFSYFTDGFAYAGEALTGRFIGEQDKLMTRKTVRYIFVWSMAIAVAFTGLYKICGVPILRLLTSDESVVQACRAFLPWLILMPPLGCAAFTWDGVFLGAAESKPVRDTMFWAMIAFFGVWMAGKTLFMHSPESGLNVLMAAYFAHLLARTLGLSIYYPYYILNKPFIRHN